MNVGKARVPMIIGIVGAFVLMGVAIFVAIGTSQRRPDATMSPSPTVGLAASDDPSPDASTTSPLACVDQGDPVPSADQVMVFFTCEPPPADPRPVFRIDPGVPSIEAQLRLALEQLLAGPTPEERDLGYSSVFPLGSEKLLIGVDVAENGLATVDFGAALQAVGRPLNSSHNRFLLFGTIGATIFQFDEVQAVEFRIAGSCEQFARHFETTCEPWRRGSTDFSPG
ncbi:MAG: GerMN domain-containing protein [Candidatus Limnocylindria bacterium]